MTPPAHKPRILIVEDEVVVARDVQMQLIDLDYAVAGHATQGEKALDLVAELKPDLVLMDIQLAGPMNGITAAQIIRERFSLPVIFLTAFANDDTLALAKLAKPFGYIIKPFSERELRTVLEMAFYKHQTELKLQQSEERLRLVLEGSRDGVWDRDLIRNEAYYSARWFQMLGYEPYALKAGPQLWLQLLHPEDAVRIEQYVSSVLAGQGCNYEFEARMRHRAGHYVPILARGWVVRDPEGRAARVVGANMDLTERKQAEQALRLSDSALKAISQGVVIAGADRKIISVNSAFTAITGYFEEDAIGRNCDFLQGPGTDPQLVARIRAAFKSEQIFSGEILNYHKSGTPFWNDLMIAPLRDKDGQVTHYVGIIRDITGRKQTELELTRSRALIDSSDDAIISKTPQGLVTSWNAAAQRVFGYSEQEMLGRSLVGIFPPDRIGEEDEIIRRIQAGERISQFETLRIRKDGTCINVAATISSIKDSAGCMIGVSIIVRDITARKQAEEVLRQSEARFRELAESIREVFWVTDPGKQRMLYISPAFEAIWGRSCASLYAAPRSWLEAVHPEDREFVRRAAETKQADGSYDETYRIIRPDGELLWIHDRAFPVRNEAGELQRIVGTAEDVTERLKLEEQFRQSQKMEVVGQLAGGVAHDFNNILAVIQLQAGLLRSSCGLPPAQMELAAEIERAAQRAANLTQQLLTFSRRQNLQLRDLDLNGIVAHITKMLHRMLGENVQMVTQCHSQPLFVHADSGMLDQVLMNLTLNARDAMPKGGQLTITTTRVEFPPAAEAQSTLSRSGPFACLTVSDGGCGIDPEVLPRIFEPFFTTKDVGKGTGLGLATVFGIIQQHQGWIDVSSTPGCGSQFRIYLPLLTHPVPSQFALQPSPPMRGGSETILLVEDDSSLRLVVRSTLSFLGYRIIEAANGSSALQLWSQNRAAIRLLLTDMVLPDGMNGRELAANLQSQEPNLKVIYSSGYSAEVAGADFPLHRGVNFIPKPYQISELASTIRNCLDKE